MHQQGSSVTVIATAKQNKKNFFAKLNDHKLLNNVRPMKQSLQHWSNTGGNHPVTKIWF